MTNRHNGASAGGRNRRALGPYSSMPSFNRLDIRKPGMNKLSLGKLALACLLLAASPSLAAKPVSLTAQPAAAAAATVTMTSAATAHTFTTVMPEAQNCQQRPAARPAPSAAEANANDTPCLGALPGKLLGVAARKAGKLFSGPVLVF